MSPNENELSLYLLCHTSTVFVSFTIEVQDDDIQIEETPATTQRLSYITGKFVYDFSSNSWCKSSLNVYLSILLHCCIYLCVYIYFPLKCNLLSWPTSLSLHVLFVHGHHQVLPVLPKECSAARPSLSKYISMNS
jgi:hypothetical protein